MLEKKRIKKFVLHMSSKRKKDNFYWCAKLQIITKRKDFTNSKYRDLRFKIIALKIENSNAFPFL